ncbi:hypothetical protein EBH_0072440, partial [Eimeria brunetti]
LTTPHPPISANQAPRDPSRMAHPKKPVADMPLLGQTPEDLPKMRHDLDKLQECLRQMSIHRTALLSAPSPLREKGDNMQSFLTYIEHRFQTMALPQELWDNELREYLDGETLRCWLDLKQFDTDMTDGPHVKPE